MTFVNGELGRCPPPQKHPFAQNVEALKGEMGAVKPALERAEAAVRSSADRQTLQQQGAVLDQLISAVDGMVTP